MALLDHFRSLPGNKHPDPDVRLAHVEALSLEEREQLAAIAREDDNARVRRAAVAKLMDPTVLAAVARDDADASVRTDAASMLRDIAVEAFEETGEPESLAAVDAVSDAKILSHIAKVATRESVARRALARLTDSRAAGSVARHAVLESIRLAALSGLHEHGEIVAVAMNSEFKDTGVAAVERLTERAELEQVAQRSNNKSAAKRARVILREWDQRAADEAAASQPPRPDAAERDIATERREIVQRLQRLRVADDLAAADASLRGLEARWVSLLSGSPAAEPDELAQFADAAARLTARLAEMRALKAERERVEVEAARQRAERLAAERHATVAAAEEQARKDAERRRLRLGELVEEIEAAASEEDLRAGRRRVTLALREWTDLTAASLATSELTARCAAAEARLTARETEAKDQDARTRRDALKRVQQLLGRVEALTTQETVPAKAAERALRDVRTTLAAMPPLPSKAEYEDALRRLKAVQAALTPKLQELRAIEDWQRWANVGIQEVLCEKMEALKSLEDVEEIVRRVRDLQQQWRQAADVPRAQGEALWRRFKTAHDEVWSRCEAQFAADAQKRAENLAQKTALCERAEALTESTNWIQTAEEIKRLQADWKTIGAVSRGQEKAIWERFRGACDHFFTRRHEDLAKRKATWADNLLRKEALCTQAEALAESTEWDAAAADLKRLQAEWKTIGPVKKSRSEAVWQRFRGACDRFFARYAQRHEIAKGERAAAREAICAELEVLAGPRPSSEAAQSDVDLAAASAVSEEPPSDLMAAVRALRSRWQQEIAKRGVDPVQAAALDRRFAAAHQHVIAKWPRVFSGTDLDPDANRERMETILRRVETLASSLGGLVQATGTDEALSPTTRLAAMLKEALAANTIGGKVDEESRWRAAQEDVRQAQASWLRIGPVPEPTRSALTDRFQRACRRITERSSGSARTSGPGGQGGPGRPGGPARSDASPRPG